MNNSMLEEMKRTKEGLYDPGFEHDNCGIGAIVDMKGRKSHDTVEGALNIVENLEHRAGKDAEGKTGDGVGILLQISHRFFTKAAVSLGFELGEERDYGIGMFFFPQDELKRNQAKKMFEIIVQKEYSFWDGEPCRFIRRPSDIRLWNVCPVLCSALSEGRRM